MSATATALHAVYHQRIALAVEAARTRSVTLCVDGDGDTAFVVWRTPSWCSRHVIAAGSERGMRALLPGVQAEFERQMAPSASHDGACGSLTEF